MGAGGFLFFHSSLDLFLGSFGKEKKESTASELRGQETEIKGEWGDGIYRSRPQATLLLVGLSSPLRYFIGGTGLSIQEVVGFLLQQKRRDSLMVFQRARFEMEDFLTGHTAFDCATAHMSLT